MSDHVQGEMNIEEQEKTYAGFLKLGKYLTIFCILVLIFLAVFNS